MRKKKKKRRFLWWWVIVGGGIFLLLLGGAFFYRQSLAPVASTGKQQVFIVYPEEEITSIAQRLEKEGLIKNEWVFLAEIKRGHWEDKIASGDFRLSPAMSLREIIITLSQGNIDVWVTIIPGWRWEQVAQLLKEKMVRFDSSWQKELEKENGFLFPDSYLVPKEASKDTFLSIVKENYRKKVTPAMIARARQKGLTEKEMIIFASLVEREAKDKDGRLIVAQVLFNRLRNNWPLQVDATVQYALASQQCPNPLDKSCSWWPKVSGYHLHQIDSPFNTYLHRGLPPAPICNPSLQSIEAVLQAPFDSPYWYYFSDDQGVIHPSRTLDEHEKGLKLSISWQRFLA